MAILDAENCFTMDLTTGTIPQTLVNLAPGGVASTNVIDTGSTKDVGPGNKIQILAQITTTVTSADGMTDITFKLQTDSAAAFNVAVVDLGTVTVPIASMVKGYQIPLVVVPQHAKRYLRMFVDDVGGTANAGAFVASVVSGVQQGFGHTF